MVPTFQGERRGTGRRFGVVVSRFSKVDVNGRPIGALLLEGCLARLRKGGVAEGDITVAWTPGAFELPLAAQALIHGALRSASSNRLSAVIALGCVIRGETPHFEFVAGAASRGIAEVALTTGVPVLNGILTCDTDEQAVARAGGACGHKGIEAAEAALEMAALLESVAAWAPRS